MEIPSSFFAELRNLLRNHHAALEDMLYSTSDHIGTYLAPQPTCIEPYTLEGGGSGALGPRRPHPTYEKHERELKHETMGPIIQQLSTLADRSETALKSPAYLLRDYPSIDTGLPTDEKLGSVNLMPYLQALLSPAPECGYKEPLKCIRYPFFTSLGPHMFHCDLDYPSPISRGPQLCLRTISPFYSWDPGGPPALCVLRAD